MMEQVRLFAVCPMENWLGSSLYQIQGWTTFRESYSRALKQRPLVSYSLHALPNVWVTVSLCLGYQDHNVFLFPREGIRHTLSMGVNGTQLNDL